ncbi:MAG: type II toxin-antitoxin system RelE/ParE family toxin [Sulfurimonas sp.]|nr:type II toxin-antitoxin system RelE/ParE family toxin [Sulfurimonas sp.]
MRIVRSANYTKVLKEQIKFISLDSKNRALAFKGEIDKKINDLVFMPYKCRKSIYFEDESKRDLIYKGYTIVYKIDEIKEIITILGMKKYNNTI